MKRLVIGLAMMALSSSLQAAPIVIGAPADPNQGNSFPFGGAFSGEYQQVYTARVFSGPMTITGLEFYNTSFRTAATFVSSGIWDISLSTTPADWDTLSSTLATNKGVDNTLVFSGDLYQPWTFGNTLVISFATPFSYNPANGNLLLDVYVTGAHSYGDLFFDTNGSSPRNTIMSRAYPSVDQGFGLVTGFETGVTPVPEPGSTLLLLGIGLVGLRAWRRRP